MKKLSVFLSLLMSMLLAQYVFAAPFCAVTSFGKQCYYYTLDSCLSSVELLGGVCIINQKEVKKPVGTTPFCLVTSYATQCIYYDIDSCKEAADLTGGACAVNPNVK